MQKNNYIRIRIGTIMNELIKHGYLVLDPSGSIKTTPMTERVIELYKNKRDDELLQLKLSFKEE